MEKITCAAEIKIAIQNLEFEHDVQGKLLKDQLMVGIDSLKPVNLIKSSLQEITTSPYLIDNMFGAVTGLVGGYLSRRITVGGSHNLFRKIAGSLIQFGVTNVVSKHSGLIKTVGTFITHKFYHKNNPNIEKT